MLLAFGINALMPRQGCICLGLAVPRSDGIDQVVDDLVVMN